MSANSKQVNGTHYKKLAYEPWDLALNIGMNGVMLFLTKYIVRWRDKNGIEDLEKALHCIEKLQEFGFLNIKGFFITKVIKLIMSYFGLGKYLGYTKKKIQKLDMFCEQLPLNEALIIKKAALGEFEDAKAEIRKLILEEGRIQKQQTLTDYTDSVKELKSSVEGATDYFRG